jgi:ParB family chromosome partitioning protein
MATAVQKITLSSSRDIPFNKLVLSQSNVRRVKAGVSIEELAEDIARRTLLQGLNVRPVLDAECVFHGIMGTISTRWWARIPRHRGRPC